MAVIKTENLTYVYGEGTPFRKTAVDNVNIEINDGEMVGIIGHTGSGKSTLIQHFNGLLKPTSGSVYIDGERLWDDKSRLRYHKRNQKKCYSNYRKVIIHRGRGHKNRVLKVPNEYPYLSMPLHIAKTLRF